MEIKGSWSEVSACDVAQVLAGISHENHLPRLEGLAGHALPGLEKKSLRTTWAGALGRDDFQVAGLFSSQSMTEPREHFMREQEASSTAWENSSRDTVPARTRRAPGGSKAS